MNKSKFEIGNYSTISEISVINNNKSNENITKNECTLLDSFNNNNYSCFSIKHMNSNNLILNDKKELTYIHESSRSVLDPIYGSISIPDICWKFIDTEEFQRLRTLKQLGNSHFVFPGATHTRFEHSIGTGYLANLSILKLLPENISPQDKKYKVEGLTLSGLLHDIGHGPFSHLFDKLLEHLCEEKKISDKYTKELCEHEYRSAALIDLIVDKYYIDIESDLCYLAKNLILGGEYKRKEEGIDDWIYEIVANKINSIDVDKFDYLQRDNYMIGLKSGKPNFERIFFNSKIINNSICYNAKNDNDLFNLFQIRHKQYKQIYYHKTTVAIDLMCKDALMLCDSYFDFLGSVRDLNKFTSFNDSILNKISIMKEYLIKGKNIDNENLCKSDIIKAGEIIDRIKTRDLYCLVAEILLTNEKADLYGKIKSEDLCVGKLTTNDIIVNFHSIDYGNKARNPFDTIKFYNNNEPHLSNCIKIWKSSLSVPQIFQEKFLRVYCRDSSLKDEVLNGLNIYLKKQLNENFTKSIFVNNQVKENEFIGKKRSNIFN